MKPNSHPVVLSLSAVLAAGLLLSGVASANPNGKGLAKTTTANRPSTQPVTLNFVNADIEAVARTLATLTGRNVVVDPRVKGTLTLNTEQPVPWQEAWNQFLAALRLQGFAVVEAQGLYKLVPEADAKLQGGALPLTGENLPAAGGAIVTQVFRLNHEQANNLVPVLRPLISPNNTLNANPGNNSLVITDYADNLQRLARIIAALDVANATDVEVIPLRHAIATDLAPLVSRLIEPVAVAGGPAPAGQPGSEGGYRTTLLAEPRSNALILRAANPARLAMARTLIQRLDQPGANAESGNLHVVYLKNAEANKLAVTLRAAIAAQASASGTLGNTPTMTTGVTAIPASTGQTPTSPGAGAASTGGLIQADPATNALIITAPMPLYRQLRSVIDQLDQRRAQVLVESLIVEVNAEKAAQFGFQWQNVLGKSGGTAVFGGTSFGASNLPGVSGALASGNAPTLQSGLNIGSAREVNGRYFLTNLANFLQTNLDANILSTPTLLTLDNEEAKIVVGQNVAIVTGQFTNTAANTTGTINPFQTFERRDVGLTLKVKPQISETGTVRMTVSQEVSSIVNATTTGTGATDRVFNKRSIDSNVLVEDGGLVVLGGLLSDDFSGERNQVPGAGDIPFFGALFRNENRARKKTNLMVFLRPVVLRDAASTEALSINRYEQMLGLQQGAQPANNPLLGVNGAAQLPPLAPKAPTPSAPAAASPAATTTPNAPR